MKHSTMLYTVSTAALVAASANVATAQSLPEGYSLTILGGASMANDPFADKIGSGGPSGFSSESEYGYLGAISLERRISPQLDLTFGATMIGDMTNRIPFSSGSFFASGFSNSGGGSGFASGYSVEFNVDNALNFQALDFEVGYRAGGSESIDVRMFAGLRAAQINSNSMATMDKIGETSGGYAGFSGYFSVNSAFQGVGPRAGVGFSTRNTGGGFGFSGKIGASALFGSRTDTFSSGGTDYGYASGAFYDSGFSSSGYSETFDTTVYSLDVDLGIDYHLNDSSKLTLGVKAMQLWNVDLSSDEDSIETEPRITTGVYLGYTTTF